MPCYYPLKGYRSRAVGESGKRSIVFDPGRGFVDMPVSVPCGQCIGCRLDRSRQWAIRCYHEAQLHGENSFITLTYDDAHLPPGGTLVKKDFQDFMKRLRERIAPRRVRYFHCGEYGEKTSRPHYHACLFGFDFDDKALFRRSRGISLYVSDTLSELWPFGFSTIGDVTFESAAYVARYILKKHLGEIPGVQGHVDTRTGEISEREREYTTMSRRPGIGREWYEKFKNEVYPHDEVIVQGRRMKPPRFYDRILEEEHEHEYLKVKAERKKAAERSYAEGPDMRSREKVKKAQVALLRRELE